MGLWYKKQQQTNKKKKQEQKKNKKTYMFLNRMPFSVVVQLDLSQTFYQKFQVSCNIADLLLLKSTCLWYIVGSGDMSQENFSADWYLLENHQEARYG